VISIGTSIPYPNQTLWLRLDLPALRETAPDSIPETTRVIRKRLGEPAIILPPNERYRRMLGAERQSLFEENCRWLQAHPDLFARIIKYYRNYRYPFIPDLDADASLYQVGFFSRADEKRCRQFHAAPLHQKANLVGKFSNPDACILAGRILCRNYPETCSEEVTLEFQKFLSRVNPCRAEDTLLDYRGDRRTTPSEALSEIHRLKASAELAGEQLGLLDDLERYLRNQFLIETRPCSGTSHQNAGT
jgi:exodeoxyribonuclease I